MAGAVTVVVCVWALRRRLVVEEGRSEVSKPRVVGETLKMIEEKLVLELID